MASRVLINCGTSGFETCGFIEMGLDWNEFEIIVKKVLGFS